MSFFKGEGGALGLPGAELAGSESSAGAIRWAPLVPLVAAVALGITIDGRIEPWSTPTWAALALGAGAAALLASSHRFRSNAAIIAAAVALGGGWHHVRWFDRGPDDLGMSLSEVPKPVWIRGVIREALGVRPEDPERYGSGPARAVADQSASTRFVMDLTAASDGRAWRPVSGRALVIVTGDRSDIEGGEAIEAVGQIAVIAGPKNPGEFDYRQFLRAQGIDMRLSIDAEGSLRLDPDAAGSGLARALGKLRAWTRQRLVGGVDPRVEPLAAAFLLGRREAIDPEVNDAFARTGTTHLIAISGLHMQVLAAALLVAARGLGVPRRPAYLGVAAATIGYAVLVGPAPSVVRSTVMTVTFCVAAVSGRMTRPANVLALAALATLVVNPSFLFDIGCQLSFLAIIALFWLVPPAREVLGRLWATARDRLFGPPSPLDRLERRNEAGWRTSLRAVALNGLLGVTVSTVVWLSALPLVAMTFHIVAPVGVLLNIPLVPITSGALLLGGVGLGLSSIWRPLGLLASRACGFLLDLTQRVVIWGVDRPWGYRFVPGPSLGWVLVFYALLGLAAASRATLAHRPQAGRLTRQGPWWLLAVWSLAGWIAACFPAAPRSPEADVLAVGHGLSVVVHSPAGRVLLYDCGRLGDPSVGRRIIAPALWSRGIARVDEVILSHADLDHYNGLPDLLDRFAIGRVRVSPGFGGPSNPDASRLIEEVRRHGIPIEPTTAPHRWDLGGIQIAARHPPTDWFAEASDNAHSLVLDFEYGGRHLLLTGDVEQLGLTAILSQPGPEPPPDVMLSPHHGGRSANPAALYDWARPRAVVVSQRAPRAGTADSLAQLDRRGLPLWRTWRDGAIHLTWTRDGIRLKGFLDPGQSPTTPAPDDPESQAGLARSFPLATISVPPWPRGLRIAIAVAGFGIGLVVWALVTVVEFGAWTLVVPPRIRRGPGRSPEDRLVIPDVTPDSEPIEAVAPDGVRLAGRWYPAAAEHASQGRTVLLIHGFGENRLDWEDGRVAILNRHGWNVAALDSRGYGQSGGTYSSFGGREAGDLVAWLDAIAGRPAESAPSAPLLVALWGRSMGSAIAMRAAAMSPRIEALVLESPMADLDTAVAALLHKRGLRLTGLLARLITRRAGRIAGVPLHRPRPLDVAPVVRCPTLIIHGTDDWLTPPADVNRLADSFPSTPARIEVPGAGHSKVVHTGGEELIARIARFLDQAMPAARPPPADG